MKEQLLKILKKHSSGDYYPNYFKYIHENNFEEVADEIVEKYNIRAEIDDNLIFDLEKRLFNSETHYEILKENYDLVFKWISETKGCSEDIAFASFKGWLLQENIK